VLSGKEVSPETQAKRCSWGRGFPQEREGTGVPGETFFPKNFTGEGSRGKRLPREPRLGMVVGEGSFPDSALLPPRSIELTHEPVELVLKPLTPELPVPSPSP
jgi:hypothetical protein